MLSSPLIVVVGAGGAIGSVHLAALLQRKALDPTALRVGVCSSNETLLGGDLTVAKGNDLGVKIPERFNPSSVDLYRSFPDVLADTDVTGVIIATPTATHADMTVQALQAGKHVLVEKPACVDIEGVWRVWNAAVSHPELIVGVGQVLGFFPSFYAIRNFLMTRRSLPTRLPLPTQLNLSRHVWSQNPLADPAQAGESVSPFFDLGIHDLNLALQIFGALSNFEVLQVSAKDDGSSRYIWRVKVQLSFGQNTCTVDAGINADQETPFSHGFSGYSGSVEFKMEGDGVSFTDAGTGESVDSLFPVPKAPWHDARFAPALLPFAGEHLEFLKGIRTGTLAKSALSLGPALEAVELALQLQMEALRRA